MMDLSSSLKDELTSHGADMVGFGNLSEIPADKRFNLPVGISIAVKYPKEVIRGIAVMPTKEYFEQYHLLNDKLDDLITFGANTLKALGYAAIAQTTNFVGKTETKYSSLLPHKTVATRAGLGWIGKNALLVTKPYGSMIRLSSILTDAPLKTAAPINQSLCGNCTNCRKACPAHAVVGNNWSVHSDRDAIVDVRLCRKIARERAMEAIHEEITLCGKCIVVCPFTQNYLRSEG